MGHRLTALDLAFLGLETQKTPVNVASLFIMHVPDKYQGNFIRDLLEQLSEVEPGPPFNLKLSGSSVVNMPRWVEDEHFDLDYHVRHSALPQPGTQKDLMDLVSRLHSRVMDRERPLWEFHLIEGLQDNRVAVYMKMHHAAIDGMGGIALLEACFSTDPDSPIRAPWAGIDGDRSRSRQPFQLLGIPSKLLRSVQSQARMGVDLGRLLVGHGLKAVGVKPDDSPAPFTAPKSRFNVPISGARKFSATKLPLKELKRLARLTGATVNDIVLAVCSGALRKYLKHHRSLPRRSLVASVPVSIRQINRRGNQITYVSARLATHRRTPLGRLEDISTSTRAAKQEVASVMPSASINFAVMAQGLVAVMNRMGATDLLPPPANVVISNVPGPRKPLYFGGARLEGNYPLSVLVDGQALNITVLSYVDSVDFGLMACREAVPDVDFLAELIEESFEELRSAAAQRFDETEAAPARRPTKKKAGKKVVRKAASSNTKRKSARKKVAKKVARKAAGKTAKKTVEKAARKTTKKAAKAVRKATSKTGNGQSRKKQTRKKATGAARRKKSPTARAQDGR
ncbi:MAG: wax ester/triacylglycerol synthase family O-acyltransferase, partial [Pseudomonadota bacterium]